MDKKELFYLKVNDCEQSDLVEDICLKCREGIKSYLVTPNLDFLRKSYKDKFFRNILNQATYSTVDGTPLMWLSKMFGYGIKHKIPGSDFTYYFLSQVAGRNIKVFLLGGKEGVAEKAKEKIDERFGNNIVCGFFSPEFGFEQDEEKVNEIISIINSANPDVVLVCLGAPKQENFVFNNFDKLPVATYFCVGATIDFLADNIKRAPKFFRKLGCEWLYRLLKEPRRLFKRYFLDFFFLIKIIFVRLFNKKKIKSMLSESIEN